MKRSYLLNRAVVLLVGIGITASILTGCQSKQSSAKDDTAVSANAGNAQNTRPNADEMKKQMEDNIKSLVTDGTINQDQADKIVTAMTENIQRPNGNRTNNQQNAQQGSQQNNQQNAPQGNGNRQNRQGNNRLSKLVDDGVITQAQADAVMQKIRGSFPNQQRNQNQQNNQNQQSSQTSGT